MENLTIKINSQDVAMLKRIARSQDRRFDDFLQLVFAEGLEYYFCERSVSVEKLPEEYTEAERKQAEINKKISSEDYATLDEMKAAGFRGFQEYLGNHIYDPESDRYSDNLITPLCERIRYLALS
tara:strand:- start:2982 stop:3356 length:375 start_codon:yes stop_codon:yes gene_type:complete